MTPSAPPPCLRNSRIPASDFLAWAALEAERSPHFRAGVDRLRGLAAGDKRAGYARSSGPLTDRSWRELKALLAEGRRPPEERPRAWKNRPHRTDQGLRHVEEYVRGCRTLARRFLGPEDAAPLIHGLVRRAGYRIATPTAAITAPAPTGAIASSLAAHLTGASWRSGATALAEYWRCHRPREIRFAATGPAMAQPAPLRLHRTL